MQDYRKQFILALLAYGVSKDIDSDRVCQLASINYKTLLSDAKSQLSAQQIESLWKNVSLLANDPLLGLHFGESMQLAALGVVGQIVQTSKNVGDALSNAGSLISLITDLFTMRIEHGKKTFVIHLISDQTKAKDFPVTQKHMADYLMVFIVHELDGLLMKKIEPKNVSTPHAGKDHHEYTRVFRCPVHANANEYSMELSNEVLNQSIISANYELQSYLLQKIGGLLQVKNEGGVLHTRISNYLLTNSYLYSMSLEAVAANFNISPRTLQRKLKEEGVSFLQIVEEVRHRLAVHYLQSGNSSIKEVSYTLGYNEPTAFIRAFKRWTGTTPAQYKVDYEKSKQML